MAKLHLCAELIDGKATAATIRQETAAEVAALKEKTGKVWHGGMPRRHMISRPRHLPSHMFDASRPDQHASQVWQDEVWRRSIVLVQLRTSLRRGRACNPPILI